jgi:hypothetical protein
MARTAPGHHAKRGRPSEPEPILGDGRAEKIAAELLECLPILSSHGKVGVQVGIEVRPMRDAAHAGRPVGNGDQAGRISPTRYPLVLDGTSLPARQECGAAPQPPRRPPFGTRPLTLADHSPLSR